MCSSLAHLRGRKPVSTREITASDGRTWTVLRSGGEPGRQAGDVRGPDPAAAADVARTGRDPALRERPRRRPRRRRPRSASRRPSTHRCSGTRPPACPRRRPRRTPAPRRARGAVQLTPTATTAVDATGQPEDPVDRSSPRRVVDAVGAGQATATPAGAARAARRARRAARPPPARTASSRWRAGRRRQSPAPRAARRGSPGARHRWRRRSRRCTPTRRPAPRRTARRTPPPVAVTPSSASATIGRLPGQRHRRCAASAPPPRPGDSRGRRSPAKLAW